MNFFVRKAVAVLIGVLIVFPLVTFIVMSLWNGVLAVVVHVSVITFWQAAGILILSKILFGFGGGRWGRRDHKGFEWRKQMMEKWGTMTPEEKEKFKQEFKNRCRGGRWQGGYAPDREFTKDE